MEIHMQRKLRMISVSLIVTIPKQVRDLYGFKDGDIMDILKICVY
jgi:bifunctional DNA-binding transcriptional regulator/antitoxin component of YhaV-PrlF toxin-antitoxin module